MFIKRGYDSYTYPEPGIFKVLMPLHGSLWAHNNGVQQTLVRRSENGELLEVFHVPSSTPVHVYFESGAMARDVPAHHPPMLFYSDGFVDPRARSLGNLFKSKYLQGLCDNGVFDGNPSVAGLSCGSCEDYNGFSFGFIEEAKREKPQLIKFLMSRRACPEQCGMSCPAAYNELLIHLAAQGSTVFEQQTAHINGHAVQLRVEQTILVGKRKQDADWISGSSESAVSSRREDDDPRGSNQEDRHERPERRKS